MKGKDGKTRTLTAKHIIIATGSDVAPLPGVTIDEKQIVSSTGALALTAVPKKLLVVGAGVIGLELGSVWRRLGSEVTVVEFLDRITPGIDLEVGKAFQRILTKQGMTFQLSTKVVGVEKKKTRPEGHGRTGGGRRQASVIETDVMLVAIGRMPYTDNLGLDEVGVALDKRGRVITDASLSRPMCRASMPSAIAAKAPCWRTRPKTKRWPAPRLIAGKAGHVNYDAIPSVVYTFPEVATVGKTEEELKAAGIAYKVGKFPFTANARAKTIAATDGFVKILADAKTDKVLGCAHHRAGSRQPDRRSGAGDGVRRVIGRHRPHLPFASDSDRSRAPGGDGCRRLDDADVTRARSRFVRSPASGDRDALRRSRSRCSAAPASEPTPSLAAGRDVDAFASATAHAPAARPCR